MERFILISDGNKTALVHEKWSPVIAAALMYGDGCIPAQDGGRGSLSRFTYERGTGLIRTYRRGGFIRRFVKESYLLRNRAFRELEVHAYLFDRGLSVPAPLGACWERRGIIFKGAIATHEADVVDLPTRLRSAGPGRAAVLSRCGQLIRNMHDLGVFHADLQVRNILASREEVFLIDFDRARRCPSLSRMQRARNLLRLRRSFEKDGLPPADFELLCGGYDLESLPAWLANVYRAKGKLSDWGARRSAVHDKHDA